MKYTSFCYKCGKKENIEETGYFDQKTGKPTYEGVCVNLKCPRGCDLQDNHKFPKSGFFSSESEHDSRRCARCGLGYLSRGLYTTNTQLSKEKED